MQSRNSVPISRPIIAFSFEPQKIPESECHRGSHLMIKAYTDIQKSAEDKGFVYFIKYSPKPHSFDQLKSNLWRLYGWNQSGPKTDGQHQVQCNSIACTKSGVFKNERLWIWNVLPTHTNKLQRGASHVEIRDGERSDHLNPFPWRVVYRWLQSKQNPIRFLLLLSSNPLIIAIGGKPSSFFSLLLHKRLIKIESSLLKPTKKPVFQWLPQYPSLNPISFRMKHISESPKSGPLLCLSLWGTPVSGLWCWEGGGLLIIAEGEVGFL